MSFDPCMISKGVTAPSIGKFAHKAIYPFNNFAQMYVVTKFSCESKANINATDLEFIVFLIKIAKCK